MDSQVYLLNSCLKFPFLIESEYGIRYRSLEIENIEINTEIEPSVFVMPDSIEGK